MQSLTSRLRRWEQLSRYYVNKWHYDGSKFVERVWYGQGTQGVSRAQVPFMITRHMRQQLEAAGFPGDEIARMLPQAAHQAISDKVTYARYIQQKQEQLEIERLAQAAKDALAKEEALATPNVAQAMTSSTTSVASAVSTELRVDVSLTREADSQTRAEAAVTSVAVVPQQEPTKL